MILAGILLVLLVDHNSPGIFGRDLYLRVDFFDKEEQ